MSAAYDNMVCDLIDEGRMFTLRPKAPSVRTWPVERRRQLAVRCREAGFIAYAEQLEAEADRIEQAWSKARK